MAEVELREEHRSRILIYKDVLESCANDTPLTTMMLHADLNTKHAKEVLKELLGTGFLERVLTRKEKSCTELLAEASSILVAFTF